MTDVFVTPSCIGCGYCCKRAPCAYAAEKVRTFEAWKDGREGCPFLRLDEKLGRHLCGLILDADEHERRRLLRGLYIGAGCCSSLNTDRRDLLRRLKEKR